MNTLLKSLAVAASVLAAAGTAYAQPDASIPEPGVLELAGIGIAVAIAAYARKRRK